MHTKTDTHVHSLLSYVHDITLNGFHDRETGTVEYGPGWFGQVGRMVVHQDPQGFNDLLRFDTVADADAFMDDMDSEYSQPDDDDDDDDDDNDTLAWVD